ncbi:MAG: chemotaxis protein [Candidatus Scalindua rubra]|uniref:Chemotaxis protein n=1 Tax=Candidatus Scalindua rubra TaxID=1872076 RepID=A0A1E3XF51_9BACT|nr:MAG: chemotaxis protein [Candidatus Scalindua rubra]
MTTAIYENVSEEIINSTQEIFSTMIPMELKPEDTFYQNEEMLTTDVIALVSFTGEYSGIIALFCEKDIALKITSNMLGMEVTELDHDTKDAIGEVTNMIAGTLKNKVYKTFGAMHLSVPIVIGGAELSISSCGAESHKVRISSSVTCNSQSSWSITPFSSSELSFKVGLIVKKND